MRSTMPTYKLEDKQIIKLILIVMTVCGIVFLFSALPIYWAREGLAAQYRVRDLVSEISRAGGSSIKRINTNTDEEDKTFQCTVIVSKSCTPDTCNAMRKAIDMYLIKDRDYFLNNGYVITIFIREWGKGPSDLIISNQNYYSRSKELYNSLACLSICVPDVCSLGGISKYKNWTDLRLLELKELNSKDISVLSQFTGLKYISKQNGFTNKETQEIKQMLPYCKINSQG